MTCGKCPWWKSDMYFDVNGDPVRNATGARGGACPFFSYCLEDSKQCNKEKMAISINDRLSAVRDLIWNIIHADNDRDKVIQAAQQQLLEWEEEGLFIPLSEKMGGKDAT
jgi:hypothetical protein